VGQVSELPVLAFSEGQSVGGPRAARPRSRRFREPADRRSIPVSL